MSKSRFCEISTFSELFCNRCFSYNRDISDETLRAHLKKIVEIIRGEDEDIREFLFLFVEKGTRTAFLKQASIKTQTGEKATDGITSDNEFMLFLDELSAEYTTSHDYAIITEVFDHMMTEVNSLGTEINVTALQSFNSVDTTYNKNANSINGKIKNIKTAVHSLKEEHTTILNDFHDEIHSVERRMHESNITILGIFSAVVLVFNAAISFYSATIGAFGSFSTYKTVAILLIIGIILVGAMMGLFYYLDRVRKSAKSDTEKYVSKMITSEKTHHSKNKKESHSEKDTIYILDKTEGRASILTSLLPFAIVIALLIIGLILVLLFWKNGCIEMRNRDIAQSVILLVGKPT